MVEERGLCATLAISVMYFILIQYSSVDAVCCGDTSSDYRASS